MATPATRVAARVQSLPKQPPHSIEAEQSVLGGLMLRNDAFADVSRKVSAEDFYRTDHQLLFSAITEMLAARKPCDFVTLTEHLRNAGRLQEAGDAGYIGSLAADTYSLANIIAYADVIRERSVMRRLIAVGHDIGDIGYRPDGRSADEALEQAERLVFELRQARRSETEAGPLPASVFVTQAEGDVERMRASGGRLTGLATGFAWLDERTKGLQPGDLAIIAARPAMGKTTLALNIADHAALELGLPVAVFSMEMQGKQLSMRTLANLARVHLQRLRGGQLNDGDWDRLTAASALVRAAKIFIDETGALSPLDIRARARRLKAAHDIRLVVVDYIQLMQVPGFRENRTNEVSMITRSLKALAKELGIPIIALSQLSRANEKENRKPKLSDLRDSGGIEQDADLVLFIHRDEQSFEDEEQDRPSVAEIIIGKQRSGPLGHRRMHFLGSYNRFEEMSNEDFREYQTRRAPAAPSTGFGRLRGKGKDAAAGGDS